MNIYRNTWNNFYRSGKHNKHPNSQCDICVCSSCKYQTRNGCEGKLDMCDDCSRTLYGCMDYRQSNFA